jgi:hypothetical protein
MDATISCRIGRSKAHQSRMSQEVAQKDSTWLGRIAGKAQTTIPRANLSLCTIKR